MDSFHYPPHAELTPSEQGVLAQLLHGLLVVDIAAELGMAASTARMHVKRLHAKTHTANLHSLSLWAVAHTDCCMRER